MSVDQVNKVDAGHSTSEEGRRLPRPEQTAPPKSVTRVFTRFTAVATLFSPGTLTCGDGAPISSMLTANRYD